MPKTPPRGKKYLAGREESDRIGLSIEEQEQQILEAGGSLDEEGSTFQEEVVEEAQRQGIEIQDVKKQLDEEEQKSLPGIPAVDKRAARDGGDGNSVTVVKGRILAEFVKSIFSRDSNDDRYVGLEFSVKLTDAHKKVLPQKVLDAWQFVADGGGEGVKDISIKPQTVRIFLTSDSKEEEVLIVGGIIEHAKVDIIEERGAGEAVKFTRYSFRVVKERSKSLLSFSDWNDGTSVWLDMKATQANML